ncbi:hypothetical protein PRZ48_009575 [Zasmidium cellare]|uniref:D-xylose 1-dehydrogenase (NADP(+), D-xylono-1,5-lactone-forming) n=1 Tax=Zasmidium cellare TaxID=395010 RepID=A0ABR0ED52_ZASCE|nr:hypothetical protein PRZ48_009575 [Zasmidium cellare]
MSLPKKTCRWAALSLSSIATVFLPDLLRQDDTEYNHELWCVSTTGTDERARKLLEGLKIPRHDVVKIYSSWEQMLKEAEFDVVYISTPSALHYGHTVAALEAKRNVLVEKPAAMNKKQYERCIELAKKNDVVLMEALWTRYLPATKYFLEELLPKLGTIRRVYSEWSFPIVSDQMPESSRFLDKSVGAGSLVDMGCYALTWVDLALNGLEPDSETKVVYSHYLPVPDRPGDIDDITTTILTSKNATALVTTSMTLPGSSKCAFYMRFGATKSGKAVRIEGSRASVAIPFPSIRPKELHVQWYGNDVVNEDGTERDEVIKMDIKGWGLWYQGDVIAKAVREGQKGVVIGEAESLRVLDWLDQARSLAGIKYDESIERV